MADNEYFLSTKMHKKSVCNDCYLQEEDCEWDHIRSCGVPKGESGNRVIWCTGLSDNRVDHSLDIKVAKIKGLPDIPTN